MKFPHRIRLVGRSPTEYGNFLQLAQQLSGKDPFAGPIRVGFAPEGRPTLEVDFPDPNLEETIKLIARKYRYQLIEGGETGEERFTGRKRQKRKRRSQATS